MKLLYIALCDLEASWEKGIQNKVWSQLKSFSRKFDTYLISWENFIICTYHEKNKVDKHVLLSYAQIYDYIENFVDQEKIEVIFLRYLQTNPWLNAFLKKMKQRGVKVIIEFPTVPYEEELKGRVELEEDQIYRKELKKYVRYSTNYNGLRQVFGIPSISLHNGINIEDIPIKAEHNEEAIILVGVAAMAFWQGYDRMIKGLADYYKQESGGSKRKVIFRLVGLGKEIPRYQDLIVENNLEEVVFLEGMKSGKELDAIFETADIAVGSLGMFRKNMTTNSSIKTKEYCARGIPIILGSEDLAFQGELDFIHRVPNDESNICVDEIVAFYGKYQKRGSSTQIREYAKEYLTWDKQFEKLYEFVGL